MEVAKQQALQAIESRFSSELLEMILSGPARAAEVPERLRVFGIDPSGPLAVITIMVGSSAPRRTGWPVRYRRSWPAAGRGVVVSLGYS
jgi:hypothetical protein